MYTCGVCKWAEVPLDDVVILARCGYHCLCLRCYRTETGTRIHPSKGLRREIESLMAGNG